MGSSDTGGVSDCSVGSIVWVRRRNGSWWPGKILGTEEIPAAHVTSPRSGTPVKLLGREDASVDWYNLEKSKRVKAFRCGEFDNCIERAEAAQGMPPKKREKYARREDAILHALELERQLMEKKYGKTGNSFCARSQASPDAITSSQYVGIGSGKQHNLLSDQPSCSSLFEKNGTDQHMYEDNYRDRDQRSGEDDSAGLFPRMRGLQDFGLRTTPSSRGELPGAPLRAKRSKHAGIQYDSVDSAHDTQTVSSSMEIVVSKVEESNYPVNAGEDQISGSTEDTETDCSETDSLESDSDEDMTGISDGSASIELHPKYPGRIEVREDRGSISSSDDIDGFAYGNGLSHPFPQRPVASGTSVSKWQLKGKRNNRNLEKRAFEASDVDVSRGYMNHRKFNRRKSILKADLMDKSFSTHIPRHLSTGLHSSNEINDLEAWAWNNQSATRRYMDDGMEYVDPSVGKHYFGGRGVLIDVELQVKANNYNRDAPMISLTSKLNGHAIVGHSIQVEPLENGSSAKLVPTADCFSSEPLESPALPCVWRTGRRTANFRVPRPFVSSILDCNSRETAQLVNHGVEHPFTSNHGRIHQQASMARRGFSQYPVERKFSRNSPKKISQSPNQKIRSLSSIPAQDKHNSDPNTGAVHRADGLNKTENIPAVVACIPVNLVFCRLLGELVGRHQ